MSQEFKIVIEFVSHYMLWIQLHTLCHNSQDFHSPLLKHERSVVSSKFRIGWNYEVRCPINFAELSANWPERIAPYFVNKDGSIS